MGRRITMATRDEVLQALSVRYVNASRGEKGRILDEFTAVSGHHRKHAVRLLNRWRSRSEDAPRRGRRVYKQAVREALLAVWEAADRICGKRLRAVLPTFVDSLEHHGHLGLDDELRAQLLAMSASTMDRLLAPAREATAGKRRRRRSTDSSVKRRIPVRTFADWDNPEPGYFEGDFVVHSGGSMAGQPIHTLCVTDIASGWTDGVPLLAREKSLVVAALDALRAQLPMRMLGLDTDNDGAFINETLIDYCVENRLVFTRCRARRKNDQAWIEQKNGAVVRRMTGYARYEGLEAGVILGDLFRVVRLYVNYFQPSFKLREKIREGAKVTKRYFSPATPCDRLLAEPRVDDAVKQHLRDERARLDPVLLIKELRDAQSRLAAWAREAQTGGCATPDAPTVEGFIRDLPKLWQLGEPRATHQRTPRPARTWRTRKDPFEEVWPRVMQWLHDQPNASASDLLPRLEQRHPGKFSNAQLRTLQRRVHSWRRAMATQLLQMYTAPTEDGVSTRGDVTRGRA